VSMAAISFCISDRMLAQRGAWKQFGGA